MRECADGANPVREHEHGVKADVGVGANEVHWLIRRRYARADGVHREYGGGRGQAVHVSGRAHGVQTNEAMRQTP